MHQRALKEREKLSKLHLITSADELHDALSEIDGEAITAKKKMEKKRTLLREQINIRKKVMNQKIKIHLTQNRRQHRKKRLCAQLENCLGHSSGQVILKLVYSECYPWRLTRECTSCHKELNRIAHLTFPTCILFVHFLYCIVHFLVISSCAMLYTSLENFHY